MITQDGKIYIFSGKTRSGKTAKAVLLMQALKKRFVIAWDPDAQWCELKGFKKITSIIQLREIVKAGKVGKYAFVSNRDLKADFEKVCACVFHYAYFFGESLFIAEELADVTSSAKAGPEWGKVVRRGLKRGLSIVAISQRWQEADKTALDNASEAFLFSPATAKGAKYLHEMLGVPVTVITELQRFQYVHYVSFEGFKTEFLPFAKPKK
jgi:hypothetical protein